MCQQQYQTKVPNELKMKQEYDYLKGQGFIDWIYKNKPIGNGDMLIEAMENTLLQEQYIKEVGLPENTELEI